MIRQPIVVLVGHVDHGKSSILEKLKDISIVKYEAGAITQKISSIGMSLEDIKKISGALLEKLKIKLTIPGLLLIDTPGHASFTNLRKRGGSIADIAILVVDVNELVKPQTGEAIEILKTGKTPFVIALNKIDLIPGWKSERASLIKTIDSQTESTRKKLDDQLYTLVGKLHELNLNVERFDKVEDHTKQIAVIPCSAKTGEGLPELVMVVSGLAQKFLESKLEIKKEGKTKGTLLEIREEKGLGIIADTIIYEGTLKVNDNIVMGNVKEPIVTKVRSLLLKDKNQLKKVDKVEAAASVIIFAQGLKEAISGMPLRVANNNLEETKKEIQREVEDILIETEKEGITIKADSLGSLEALISLLKEKNIPIKRATIGNLTKRDIVEASSSKDSLNKVILAFNVKGDGKTVKVISSKVIYKIIEDFEEWREKEKGKNVSKEFEKLASLCKVELLKGYVFRQSNPAVMGVDVVAGKLRVGTDLMNVEGKKITSVKSIQHEKKNITEIESGNQVAAALSDITIGRQVKESDILYSSISSQEFKKFKKLKSFLNSEEVQILKEIAEIKRKKDNTWGI